MLIYNTLKKKKEEFIPQNPPYVTMYVCGPTVYDYFHIGNARSFIMADVIRRYLEYRSFKVKFVMNVTDIDDKIIRKASREQLNAKDVAGKYADAFFEDTEKLSIKRADIYPKATEHMQEIIDIISKLEEKGIAYNVNGDVFFDVSKFPGYGKLSGKKIDELESGARIEINEDKKNPLDFSLWKKAKQGEPYWPSPWGNGRPGWHIECSAMSSRHLGHTIDIHAGGTDLIFPHHENEIAQSEASSGREFVKYWIHFGFLNINDEKMSKSLGNFFTAREILKKFTAETIRLFFCQTHYSGPLNFSEELLMASQKGLEKIYNLTDRINQALRDLPEASGGTMPDFDLNRFRSGFEAAMDDDFNSPQAVAVIFDFIKEANRVLAQNENIDREFFSDLLDFLKATASDVLGILDLKRQPEEPNETLQNELIELLIRLRTNAKAEKNYKLSDEIRNGLNELGITLQDLKDKTTYKIAR